MDTIVFEITPANTGATAERFFLFNKHENVGYYVQNIHQAFLSIQATMEKDYAVLTNYEIKVIFPPTRW